MPFACVRIYHRRWTLRVLRILNYTTTFLRCHERKRNAMNKIDKSDINHPMHRLGKIYANSLNVNNLTQSTKPSDKVARKFRLN